MRNNHTFTRRQVLTTIAAAAAGTVFRPVRLFASQQSKSSIRFAVIGDWGSGNKEQSLMTKRILDTNQASPFDFVVTVGDNIYPNGSGRYFSSRFEEPYADLIRRKVNFYTVLGNHDVKEGRQDQCSYPLFNMGGKTYYSLKKGDGLMEFFMLDSTDFSREQAAWLESALSASTAFWKIAVFHHPIYSSGKQHGSNLKLRRDLEPILTKYNVALGLSGHDHIYERTAPQKNVSYFVTGSAGKVRVNDIRKDTGFSAAGFDRDNSFMVFEIDSKGARFQSISTSGETVDQGTVAPKSGAN